MIDNGKKRYVGGNVILLRNYRRGSSLVLRSVTEEGKGLENRKIGIA